MLPHFPLLLPDPVSSTFRQF
uniref:Uncharacterized protein n=1 Tax=Rhizophora mucronata TaxID=61149 RepID=A0A2P2NR01_RHIMU